MPFAAPGLGSEYRVIDGKRGETRGGVPVVMTTLSLQVERMFSSIVMAAMVSRDLQDPGIGYTF